MKCMTLFYILSALFLILFLTACGSLPGESAVIEVTFDGNDCTVTGPSELPP